MLTEKQHNTGEMTLNYAEGDDRGDPIVFIHGIGGRWQQWSQEIGLVSHAWHPYSVDLRGHGKSSKADTGYKFGDYPRDIISLLENEIVGPAVLVAHSLGAVTSIGVASKRPDLVRAVVLEDPPIFSHQRLGRSRRADEFARIQALACKNLNVSELIPLVAEMYPDQNATEVRSRAVSYSGLDPKVYTPTLDGSTMDGFDAEASLSAIECPALLLQADPAMGAAMTDEESERAERLIPNCALVQMQGVGHGIHRGDPINFHKVMFDFLDTI
ncbi:MAG: alpha/beta hydrolase [Dehalococcoidia bacterium]|nr:alpha/beta hydrolase [Dehalococcoidia bacterium]